MKKQKKKTPYTPPPLIKMEEQDAMRIKKRIDTETRLVQMTGGIIGIGTLIYAGFAYGIELPIILFLVVISNNLCNVK